MTETGLSLGTPHYMSPEQATADKDITARSDIHSLASVLYEMLAGHPPHEGGSAQQVIMRIITETARRADTRGVQRLWVKRGGEVDATPVTGTDGGYSPFLSPDGSELGFFRAGAQRLNVVALAGGRPRAVTGTPIGVSGAYWATDGYIYFDADDAGIDRIRPDGSGRESVATLDSAGQVTGYAWPEVLPGNRCGHPMVTASTIFAGPVRMYSSRWTSRRRPRSARQRRARSWRSRIWRSLRSCRDGASRRAASGCSSCPGWRGTAARNWSAWRTRPANKALDDILSELESHAVRQDGGQRRAVGETANQRVLRLALRFAMRPIAEVATAQLRETPQFASLRLPSHRLRGMTLVSAARTMADAATPHKELFVASGLPADFIEQLLRAADAVSDSYEVRRDNQSVRKGATRGLLESERRGRKELRILDSLVIPALGNDDAMLEEWESARRIQNKPGPAQETGRAPGEGPPPVKLLPAAPDGDTPPAAEEEKRDAE